ncbi:hypothetical protein SAY87_015426 [Trapa incisa]|uniref:Uncharacterized protein n=1 Tax=Trapa incisa TaxID=236973 RepID=A0AAN7JLZ2_9MYRT|nr:hypothetical protein SAY87_015426 [Trapa incisa]
METANLHGKWRHFLLPLNPIFRERSSLQSDMGIVLKNAHNQSPVISWRKKRRRNGSQRLVKFVLDSIPIMASRLKILPPPLDFILEELSSGDGNSGGWGASRRSGDGWFDGWWRRGTRRTSRFWWAVLIFGLGLIVGREFEGELVYWILGFGLISIAFFEVWSSRAMRDGVLGFCCLGVFLGILGLRPDLKNWVREFRSSSPLMKSFRGRRSGRAL